MRRSMRRSVWSCFAATAQLELLRGPGSRSAGGGGRAPSRRLAPPLTAGALRGLVVVGPGGRVLDGQAAAVRTRSSRAAGRGGAPSLGGTARKAGSAPAGGVAGPAGDPVSCEATDAGAGPGPGPADYTSGCSGAGGAGIAG